MHLSGCKTRTAGWKEQVTAFELLQVNKGALFCGWSCLRMAVLGGSLGAPGAWLSRPLWPCLAQELSSLFLFQQ